MKYTGVIQSRSEMDRVLVKAGGQAHRCSIRQEEPFPKNIGIDNSQRIAIPARVFKGQVIGLVFVPAKVMQAFFRRCDFVRIAANLRWMADLLKALLHAAKVAHLVVDDGDGGGHAWFKTGRWDGTKEATRTTLIGFAHLPS